jgi:membrane carboxypeptidase/penicillin-binding protein
MRKPLIIVAKVILTLLSVSGMGLLGFEGWLIWHYEYGIGLPDADKLAAISAVGPICSVGDRRTYIPLSEIPPLVRQAVIAYEEPDFYERLSANPFTEHALASLFNRPPRPANISNSVTRCLMSLDHKRYGGLDWHIGNLVLMNRVAKSLSRDLILEIYMNESYVGRGAYGMGAAAKSYFGKPLGLLSIDEIALIAALPRMPTLLDRRKDIAFERRNVVVERMLQSGFINEAEAASAKERPLKFREESSDGRGQQQRL